MYRKIKIFFNVISFVVLIHSTSNAQSLSLEEVSTQTAGSENFLISGNSPEFFIRLTSDADYYHISNGFKIYSDDGAVWTTTIPDTTAQAWQYKFDLLFEMKAINSTGHGADTVLFRGTRLFGSGLEQSFDKIAFKIKIGPIPTTPENNQKTICLDALNSPANDLWIWANPETAPYWSGPICFTIVNEQTTITAYEQKVPDKLQVNQNYPNPFNPKTTIEFELSRKSEIQFFVYTVTGKTIYYHKKNYNAGKQTLVWDGSTYPSGIYFYRLKTGNQSISKKMILLK